MARKKVGTPLKKGCDKCKELARELKEIQSFEGKYYDEAIKHCENVLESSAYLIRIGELQMELAKLRKQRFEVRLNNNKKG